jgi:hypothetical protein
MDFVLCILIMHLSVFIFPWHDQTSIFGHEWDVFYDYHNLIVCFLTI